jgi:hypothetical protein
MGEINISNSAGRDAVVGTETVRSPMRVRWVDDQGRQASSVRVLKSPFERDLSSLQTTHGALQSVGAALIDGDPEIDMEATGRFLRETSRAYIDQEGQLVHKVKQFDIVRNPDGSERQRRPRKLLPQNVSADVPLRWSDVFIKKDEACRKFVFANKVQLTHINGLTYDFLFAMATELEEKDSLMLLGAGPKSNEPLVLRRGGAPYRGFLEGRTQGDKYCLTLHFSNLELKAPAQEADGNDDA